MYFITKQMVKALTCGIPLTLILGVHAIVASKYRIGCALLAFYLYRLSEYRYGAPLKIISITSMNNSISKMLSRRTSIKQLNEVWQEIYYNLRTST